MKIVRLDDVPKHELKTHARSGNLKTWTLLEGPEDSVDNYSLRLAEIGEYYSPRHRHSFDQVRLQVSGDMDFARDGKMVPGTVGYFPESVSYGPHKTLDSNNLQLVLQFGGASGLGYISEARYQQAMSDLQKLGSFKNGVFTQVGSGMKKTNKDGYQAVWEHVHGRPLAYAPARYSAPILVHLEDFEWQSGAGSPGVREKRLGTFEERRVGLRFVEMAAGAQHAVQGPAILFAVRGSGECDGETWQPYSAVELRPEDRALLSATEPSEWLQIDMPWSN